MFSTYILYTVLAYFGLLFVISLWSSKDANSETFYKGNSSSPWYLVAFGMIGASLSGVTFISVPGAVEAGGLTYMQMVLGYMLGYLIIGQVLMPLYYKLNLTTIYSYFGQKIGPNAHIMASVFFILSRIVGASFRLFLVVMVLQEFVFEAFGLAFWQTTFISIALIWVYTFKGGIKTVVWTDTLQTLFMLCAVGITLYTLSDTMDGGLSIALDKAEKQGLLNWMNWDSWKETSFFPRHFFAGALIALVMTGMDQDMMQKNLTCRSIKDAQKNMLWFSVALIFVNLVFLLLGAVLTVYAQENGLTETGGDKLYPAVVKNLSLGTSIVFVLGVIAAAYSSADSALTSLTTSFSIDILKLRPEDKTKRVLVHLGFSIVIFFTVVVFENLKDPSIVFQLFKVAGYTYGPILGLFAFSLIHKQSIEDRFVPLVCLVAPILTYLIGIIPFESMIGFKMGFEILFLNGLLTYIGLHLISKKKISKGLDDI